MARRKIGKHEVHYKTGVPAYYETNGGRRRHEVSTTTRHGGYDVATEDGGFVDPRTIQVFDRLEDAIAEIEKRALADYDGDVSEILPG